VDVRGLNNRAAAKFTDPGPPADTKKKRFGGSKEAPGESWTGRRINSGGGEPYFSPYLVKKAQNGERDICLNLKDLLLGERKLGSSNLEEEEENERGGGDGKLVERSETFVRFTATRKGELGSPGRRKRRVIRRRSARQRRGSSDVASGVFFKGGKGFA